MIMDMFDISGKKVIVTGGSRGLGLGMAEGFLKSGCKVAIAGSSDRIHDVAEAECKKGYDCIGVYGDLGNRQAVYQVFQECITKLGGDLDVLVTAHGIQRRHLSEEFPLQDWDAVMNVNLNSVFILCQEAGKIMLKKGYGKIINIASMNSFYGGQTIPAYSAAKGGIAQLTKALSNDWAGRGINVNAIAPGYMATEMNKALLDPANPRFATISERIPAGRWGTGEDMQGTALFLASHASDYICGAVIPVDGGYLVK